MPIYYLYTKTEFRCIFINVMQQFYNGLQLHMCKIQEFHMYAMTYAEYTLMSPTNSPNHS